MKFSVVITTYNRLNLLRRAVESAFLQTIPTEVVVVDDCSIDETREYIQSLGQRVVYVRNQVNKGHAASVNAGVLASSGHWVKFLDDDDYLAPNCLQEMAEAIALCPGAVIFSCVASQVDEKGKTLGRTPHFGPGKAFCVPQTDIHYGMLLELLPFGTPVQVSCRRDVFLETGGWDSQLDTNCDDIDCWIKIAKFGDAVFSNQCLAYRTIWTGAYNHKFSLQTRLSTNILMKEKIYALVDAKHLKNIPQLEDIKNYLKLHWVIVAIKQKNINCLIKMLDLGILSINAWWLLMQAAVGRSSRQKNPNIQKLLLIN